MSTVGNLAAVSLTSWSNGSMMHDTIYQKIENETVNVETDKITHNEMND